MAKYKKLGEQDIANLVDANIKQAVGYFDSKLSTERQRVMEHYTAKLPHPHHDGNSKYVSQDVYNAVESMKASLLEVFASGRKIVSFTPQNPEDVEPARIASEYVDYVLFRQNEGYMLFSDIIQDGLMSRIGVAKVYWQDEIEPVEQDFEGTVESLDVLLADEAYDVKEVSIPDEKGQITATVIFNKNNSKVVVDQIAPEEFIVEPRGVDLHSMNFMAHRSSRTKSELIKMCFDKKKVENIGTSEGTADLETDPEHLARFENVGADLLNVGKDYQEQVKHILVYEAYINMDIEGTGVAKRYKVCKAGTQILDVEEVGELPFVHFCPLPIPHSFYGSNFGKRVIDIQNARSILTRSILDHAIISNNPRYIVTKGGLVNPRELMNNKVGGLVNVTRPDAIQPLPQASLNPFVFQTLNVLQDNLENTTGVSSLSQGLNKDAVSKQNSAAMVEQLANLSMQRQKIIARNFANQFVRPLFEKIYRLIVMNEDREKIIDVAGNWIEVNPKTWIESRNAYVDLHLGYGENEKEAQKLLGLHDFMSKDQALQPIYSLQNRYSMMKNILEKNGIKNTAEFLTDPSTLPPPQPNPQEQLQQQMQMKAMELQERQTAIGEQKIQIQAEEAADKQDLAEQKAEFEAALKSDQQDLRERQQAHKEEINKKELELANKTDDVRAIASPTG